MDKIEIPTLDWYERYKRILDVLNSMGEGLMKYLTESFGKDEGMKIYAEQIEPQQPIVAGRKLVEKLGLKPDIEGALKLVGVYTREVWGFGDDRFTEIRRETPNKGTLTIRRCKGWETIFKPNGWDCAPGCLNEYQELVKILSPEFKAELSKCLARGDGFCEVTVET